MRPVRQPWMVENRPHRSRDMTLGKDAARPDHPKTWRHCLSDLDERRVEDRSKLGTLSRPRND